MAQKAESSTFTDNVPTLRNLEGPTVTNKLQYRAIQHLGVETFYKFLEFVWFDTVWNSIF